MFLQLDLPCILKSKYHLHIVTPLVTTHMYYSKNPFLRVGLPFLTAMVFGTFFLVDLRKSRYETRNSRKEIVKDNENGEKRTMKTLEEELREWEEKHKKKVEEFKSDYEMKPVKG